MWTSHIGMRTLLAKLTLRPHIASNNKMHLKCPNLLPSDWGECPQQRASGKSTLRPSFSDLKTFQNALLDSFVH